tara:strand:- start:265 stop:699 length:435 start_codon:yes stop_codon:yes gene_type:complete
MTNNAIRKADKKLRNYVKKNPGIIDDRYKELYKGVVVAKVAEARKLQRAAEKAETRKKQNMSSEEVLDIHFKENAEKNAEKERLAVIKEEQDKNHIAEEEQKNKEYKEFYDKYIQPELAKHIILSIVEQSEKQKFEKSKSKKSK